MLLGLKHNQCSRFASRLGSLVLAFALLNFGTGFSAFAQEKGTKAETSGIYTDHSGIAHSWYISKAHTLYWEGKPFIPVGVRWTPALLAPGAGASAAQADSSALSALKTAGVTEVIVSPPVSAVSASAENWQKVIDLLEGDGFHYGISFGEGITDPVSGTIVKPASYRIPNISYAVDAASWNVNHLRGAYFVLADTSDGSLQQSGIARVHDDTASVNIENHTSSKMVAILYPRVALPVTAQGGLPDVWSSFDTYRDSLLSIFTKLHFGPGLRFFLDPLAGRLRISGVANYLIPDSNSFLLEWEAFLARHYTDIGQLMTDWGITDRDITDFYEAAQLAPLWADNKGVTYFWDRRTDKRYHADPSHSSFWADFRTFRDASIRRYNSEIAGILQHYEADVPVVITWSKPADLLELNGQVAANVDGYGIAAYGNGSALISRDAGYALSAANANSHHLWFMVSTTSPNASYRNSNNAGHPIGYSTMTQLKYDMDWLRQIGVKGIYIEGAQSSDSVGKAAPDNLLRVPDQLSWITTYQSQLRSSSNIAGYTPLVLPFPRNAAGIASIGPVGGSGIWWLPSIDAGQPVDFGNTYAGYTLEQTSGDNKLVIWSNLGTRITHFHVLAPRHVTAETPDGQPIKLKYPGKNTVVVPVSTIPIILKTGGQTLFPVEAAQDMVKQLAVLVAMGMDQHLPVEQYRLTLDRALMALKEQEPDIAFGLAEGAVSQMLSEVKPYIWIEGEQANSQTFGEVVDDPAASGGAYLRLDTDRAPTEEGYATQYLFNINRSDIYNIWVACTPPGPDTSPFVWLVDTGQPSLPESNAPTGFFYLENRFAWQKIGEAQLNPGQHSLTIRVTQPANGRYRLDIDAILITDHPFTPDGVLKPVVGNLLSKKLPKGIKIH